MSYLGESHDYSRSKAAVCCGTGAAQVRGSGGGDLAPNDSRLFHIL